MRLRESCPLIVVSKPPDSGACERKRSPAHSRVTTPSFITLRKLPRFPVIDVPFEIVPTPPALRWLGAASARHSAAGHNARRPDSPSPPALLASGTRDTALFAPGDVTGSINGSPNNTGGIGEIDFNAWLNTRLGAQYIWYEKFNGASRGYNGSGRNASDNNTLYLFFWVAF